MQRRKVDPDTLQREDWNSLLNNYEIHDVGEAYFQGRTDEMGLLTEQWGIDMRHDNDGLVFDNKMDLRLWDDVGGQGEPATWPSDVPDDMIDGVVEEWYGNSDGTDTVSYTVGDGEVNPTESESWKLKAVCDVKTKANEDWLCAFNVRHFAHYAEWADAYDVPVFVYFTHVDMDSETVGDRNIFVPMTTDWNYALVADHFDPDVSTSLDWPDLKAEVSASQIVDRVSRAPDGNPVVWTDESEWYNFNWFAEQLRT